jgi:hypothetical protein
MQSIFYPLEQLYKFLYLSVYDITGDYGIALILLSLFIYIILFPFNQKAQQIQNAEREVQSIIAPQIEEIKRRFHGKEQYEKIQRLYHRYAYHPIYAIRSAAGIVLQIPFFVAARSMLYALPDIKGVQWGIIQDLGKPDQLLAGINLLPFVMTFITVLYAFVMPKLTKKEITQTVIIGFIFLIILYPAPSALLIFWTWNLLWSLLHCLFFDRLQWFNEYIERVRDFVAENELAFHIIFALALTVGLFVPTEVYIKNASQLWYSFKSVFCYFIEDTVKYFIVLLFVYVVFRNKKIRGIYLSVLLGLLFGVFLQSYVIGVKYGLFDGHEIDWDSYTTIGLLNTFVWLFCLIETFVSFKRFRFDLDRIKKHVKPVIFVIVVIQCIALLINLKNNPLPETAFVTKKSMNVLTTEKMYHVSSKDNIIVFLLDAFDASVFERIVEKDLTELDELRDFTFYPDTTSVFGYTHNSLPQILTGKTYYNDMPFEEYLDTAWHNNLYYEKLKSNNYDIGIYTEGTLISKNAPAENLIHEEIRFDKKSMKGLNNLALFRMAPHYIKKWFYDYNPNEWIDLLTNRNVQVYSENDMKFYLELKKGLISENDKNCFRFYHLVGAHFPYIYNREMEYIAEDEKGNEYDQCIGVLKIVKEYIRQMKQKRIFDDSTFVIMADHGFHNQIGSRPLLCIKQPRSVNKQIIISNEPISFAQFLPMILPHIGSINKDKTFAERVRKYYLQQERDFIEYSIVGNAKDLSSWHKGKVLKSWYKKQDSFYVLGTEIDCTDKNRDFEKYQGNGWFIKPDPYGTFSVGASSDMIFKIKDYHNQNLKFSFIAGAWVGDLPYRTGKVYVNEHFVSEIVLDGNYNKYTFKIEPSMFKGNEIKLRVDIDHSGIAVKEGLQDLGVLWLKLRIDEED